MEDAQWIRCRRCGRCAWKRKKVKQPDFQIEINKAKQPNLQIKWASLLKALRRLLGRCRDSVTRPVANGAAARLTASSESAQSARLAAVRAACCGVCFPLLASIERRALCAHCINKLDKKVSPAAGPPERGPPPPPHLRLPLPHSTSHLGTQEGVRKGGGA